MPYLLKLPEPELRFGHGQAADDPRDGLLLFGPLDAGKPYGIRSGVIGTADSVQRFERWMQQMQSPLIDELQSVAHPFFPGFEAAFGTVWKTAPAIVIDVSKDELDKAIHLDDRHQRVYKTVELFSNKIVDALRREDVSVDVWFVVIPDDVYRYCRPESYVEPGLRIAAAKKLSPQYARRLRTQSSLFEEDYITAVPYYFDVNFHNQLKARLLRYTVPTQIIRESTIAYRDFLNKRGKPIRDLGAMQSAIAWNLSTAVFYKAGGRPWKLSSIREGVCYIGLAFKRDETSLNPRSACCAAQMFLDSGDGVVFKGAVGPWYSPRRGDFHLSRDAARKLVQMAVNSYQQKVGKTPAELFLHGKVRFNNDEWDGFCEAVGTSTNIVGVRIRDDGDLKLYRKGKHTVLRGIAYVLDQTTAYLWTRGFIPRLQTYPGREVPRPLLIEICRGNADIKTVLADILALTKLNYNACIFADGLPVTLRFANAVGEILTAGPTETAPPLPFKFYM